MAVHGECLINPQCAYDRPICAHKKRQLRGCAIALSGTTQALEVVLHQRLNGGLVEAVSRAVYRLNTVNWF
ncbi:MULTISPECIES: hypothetical protein [Pseudomonas]|uniref:hypothetical protein n=1 Tax=Pseudomonas TaxID=286 RepID=UPI000C0D6DA5|nr:hypothetical protein [Pseudomonadaceae bacterium]HCP54155.1 hypothetical protein [Pseudomonas sp.]